MTSIRRTTVRALLGLAAAIVVGFIGASAASAQPVDSSTAATGVQARDFVW